MLSMSADWLNRALGRARGCRASHERLHRTPAGERHTDVHTDSEGRIGTRTGEGRWLLGWARGYSGRIGIQTIKLRDTYTDAWTDNKAC